MCECIRVCVLVRMCVRFLFFFFYFSDLLRCARTIVKMMIACMMKNENINVS